VDITERLCGERAAAVFTAPFSLGDEAELARLFEEAGIAKAQCRLHPGSVCFPAVQEFVRIEVKGSPLAESLSDETMNALTAESEDALGEFVTSSGELVMPMDALIVTATKF